MKRLFPLLAIVAIVATSGAAGDVYVPNSTLPGQGCNNYPFNASLGEWRYQLVVPANLLGGKQMRITDVWFAPCYSVTLSATTFEMTMSHATLPTPSTIYANNLPNPVVVIPAGPITWVRTKDTWSKIPLIKPFDYNGTDQLTIEVRYKGGSLQGNTQSTDHQTNNTALAYYRVYGYGTGAYASANARSVDPRGALMVRLTYQDVLIFGTGSPSIGQTITLNLVAPTDPNLPYQVGTSLGTGPIPIGTRSIGLSLDDLLVVTIRGFLPAVFQNYAGFLDASGKGAAKLAIPNHSGLIGVRLHSAFVTVKAGAPQNLQSISNTFSFTIAK